MIVTLIYIFRSKKANKDDDIIAVLQQFKIWNEKIKTKQGMLGLYVQLDELFQKVWSVNFKAHITKQEFEQMSIESIKQLNEQALDEMIEQLSSKPK